MSLLGPPFVKRQLRRAYNDDEKQATDDGEVLHELEAKGMSLHRSRNEPELALRESVVSVGCNQESYEEIRSETRKQ